MSILAEIFAHKRLEVEQARQTVPLSDLRASASDLPTALDFRGALRASGGGVRLIAEIKHASPSRGLIAVDFDPLKLAALYAENGAAAISVLTDERYFMGSLDYLRQVRRRLPGIPLLRKDFIYDPYQVYEARAAGADAVLLIVAGLAPAQLQELLGLAGELGMAALVEVHDQVELQHALQNGASLVGINNRDLHTFTVRLETSLELAALMPAGVCKVAESGIRQSSDVERLAAAGIQAVLVGEALVANPDPAAKVRELAGLAKKEQAG